jgi:hypothetical protein
MRPPSRTKSASPTKPRSTALFETLENRRLLSVSPATTLPAPVASMPGSSTSPGTLLTTLTPTFKWSAVAGVNGYEIHIYDQTDSQYISTDVGVSVTSYTPAAGTLHAGDKFVWNVRDLVGSTTESVSNYLYFQTPALPAPIVIGPGASTSPGPVLTTLTPTFTWKPVTSISGYTGYQINLYDETTKAFVSYVTGATATSYTLPAGALTVGNTYVWNLRLRDGAQTGAESLPYLYFQAPAPTPTTLPAPTAISPGVSASPGTLLTTLTPTFKWTAVSGVSGYQIHIYDETTAAYISTNVGASVTSYTPTAGTLAAGDDFVWNVRDVLNGVTGAVSNYLYFQTPTLPAPTIIGPGSSTSPGTTITSLTPTFNWDAVTSITGFTGYQINLYDLTTKVFTTYVVGATATRFTLPTALAANNTYVWNLRLRDGNQTGLESLQYLYFSTT